MTEWQNFWPSTINSTIYIPIVVYNVIDRKKCRWLKFRRTVVRYFYGRNLNGLACSCDAVIEYFFLLLRHKNNLPIQLKVIAHSVKLFKVKYVIYLFVFSIYVQNYINIMYRYTYVVIVLCVRIFCVHIEWYTCEHIR